MQSLFEEFKFSAILTALVELVFGLFLFLNPTASQFALCTLVGVGILFFGLFSIISYVMNHEIYWDHAQLLVGICAVIVAIIFFVNPAILFGIIGTVLGLFIIYSAIREIRRAMTLRSFGYPQWWSALLAGIVFILFGFSLLFFPNLYGNLLMQFIGAFLVIEAIADLLTVHKISSISKDGSQTIIIRY